MSPATGAGHAAPSAGKGGEPDMADRTGDDDDSSAGAGTSEPSAGRVGSVAPGLEQGGTGGSSSGAGKRVVSVSASGQGGMDPPSSGRGGMDESRGGQGGADKNGVAGRPSMMTGGGGGSAGGSAGGAGMAAPTDPCATKACTSPRAATCSGTTYVRYEAEESCPSGCMYKPKPETCPFGCTSEGCKSDPCPSITCASPPRATCANATTVRQYATTGTCQNAACDYPSSDTPCSSKSPKCHEGACVGCLKNEDCSTGDQCSSTNVCVKAQFLLIDETYTATAADIDSEGRFNTTTRFGIPTDWTKPVNFIDGMVYVELDILEKPSDVATLFNICFANSAADSCMPYAPTYTKPGRYDFNAAFPRFWQYDVMDWSKGVSKVQLYVKNDKEQKRPGNDTAFYPMKARVTVTVVAPGAMYMPPTR